MSPTRRQSSLVDLRDEAVRRDALVEARIERLIPGLLAETGIDCWVLIGREYAEDPVLRTMLPSTWLSARRRTVLVLTSTERFILARYPIGSFTPAWNPDDEPDQGAALDRLLRELDPTTIGIGISRHQAHADGLTVAEHDRLLQALSPQLIGRLTPAGVLGVRWLETRLPEERDTMASGAALAHEILRRGLSNEAIKPGTTTTTDLEWWYRQYVHDAGLSSWFHPSVSVQRRDGEPDPAIRAGDLVHVDFGIVYRGLCTDQQEHLYVTQPGESHTPPNLAEGFAEALTAQDLVMAEFTIGSTGNEILQRSLNRCTDAGLDATIYTHSIGVHGHGAGMTIGLWDRQDGVPGAGDHPLHANTAYSIELSTRRPLDGWDQPVGFMLEQDAWFDGTTCSWLDGRQGSIWSM